MQTRHVSEKTVLAMQELYQSGLALVPLGGDGKKPLVRHWNRDNRLPLDSILRIMEKAESSAYGLRMDRFVVVDCDTDNQSTQEYVQQRFPQTPYHVATSRGLHFYYAATGEDVPPSVRENDIAIDFRFGQNQFVVGPFSMRPDGTEYVPNLGRMPHQVELPFFEDLGAPGPVGSLTSDPAVALTQLAVIPEGQRNGFLWRAARAIASECDSYQSLLDRLLDSRDRNCENPATVSDSEVEGIAKWAWSLKSDGRLYAGRNSEFRVRRNVLDALKGTKGGANAFFLYAVLLSNHGHMPDRSFVIVPSAMRKNGHLEMSDSSVYRSIRILEENGLIHHTGYSKTNNGQKFTAKTFSFNPF